MLSEQVEYLRRNEDKINKVPFRCFSPLRVFNKYMNEYIYVNCRKCPACLSARSAELSSRVNKECKQHTYSLFFTLTYDNEHLPIMHYSHDDVFVGDKPIGYDRQNKKYIYPEVNVADIKDFDLDKLLPWNHTCTDGFAYANKYDVQQFLMRLRTHIKRNQEYKYTRVNREIVRFLGTADYIKNLTDYEKKIRIFICAEYGPTHFRPHYHGIVWTDSQPIARYLERNILEDWSFGGQTLKDKPTYVQGAAASYVAKYVNGNTMLPQVLQTKFCRTFFLASRNPIIGSFKNDMLQITDALVNGVVEQLQPTSGGSTTELAFVPISPNVCSRYFPKCQSFNKSDDFGKLQIIEKYLKGNFKREYEIRDGKKVLKSCFSYGLDYINSLDFKYQDYRFAMQAKFWTSHPVSFPERINGFKTGRILSKTLSLEEYVTCVNRLYSNLSLLVLRGFYYSQNLSERAFGGNYCDYIYNLFNYYPNIFYELPYVCSEESYSDSKFDDFFSTFDVPYLGLYDRDGALNLCVLSLVHDNVLTLSERDKILSKYRDSFKNKVFNEHFNVL